MAHEFLKLDNQLCFALYAASRALTQAYQPLLEPLGLTYPQYLVMLVLWETDGLSVSEVGERLSLDSGTLTPLLKRLESKRLVERRRSTDDERVVTIQLTAAGERLQRQALIVPKKLASCVPRRSWAALSDLRHELRELRAALKGASRPQEDGVVQ